MTITTETVLHVRKRDGHKCRECGKVLVLGSDALESKGELHHVFFKSQYRGKDRNDARNLALLCPLHHRGDVGVHGGNKELDSVLKLEADRLKPVAERSKEKIKKVKRTQSEEEKEKARKFARSRRESQMENFKKNNGGLTPSQVAYRQQKAFLARIKNK